MAQGVSGSDPSPSQGLYLEPKGGGILSLSQRCSQVLGYFEGVSVEESLVDFQIEVDIFFCMPLEIEEHTSYVEGLDSPHHKEWIDAMRDELDSMAKNDVWELVNLPLGKPLEINGFSRQNVGRMDHLISSKLV